MVTHHTIGVWVMGMRICQNCKHANEYIPVWIYPHGNPRCSIHHRNINPDDSCDDFELIGRLST
jgi:hypothetical protein